ncbi:sel1 repeat family protein [Stakelama pacifica]|nr:sel1 repeat family protein [Stakelama pacifica]
MGTKNNTFQIDSRLQQAARGDSEAWFDLGMVFSTGSAGLDVDLIAAHKWFNLAALNGNLRAQECRAEIADFMSAVEISEAQKQARAWLRETGNRLN